MSENTIPVALGGRKILLGVSGSIALFKVAGWVSELSREESDVTVIMTRAAERFVSALSFAALSGNTVHRDMFDENPEGVMAHINLSREADCILIAPATAQTIARLAHGMADDLLSTVVLAAKVPVLVCPAMNSNMLTHPATRQNLRRLEEIGYHIIPSDSGRLACGEEGVGRLPKLDTVREQLISLFCPGDLEKKKILITAGPTREPLDPARYLSNRSSGKMGYALARTAARRGAEVTLVSGPVCLEPPPGATVIPVTTAEEMYHQVMDRAKDMDIVVKSAAVADYRPAQCAQQKIKKSVANLQLELAPNPDILAELGAARSGLSPVLVGFAAESGNHELEGRAKLERKKADLIVVNDILGESTGFDVDTNQVILVDGDGAKSLPLLSKMDTANRIWDHILKIGTF